MKIKFINPLSGHSICIQSETVAENRVSMVLYFLTLTVIKDQRDQILFKNKPFYRAFRKNKMTDIFSYKKLLRKAVSNTLGMSVWVNPISTSIPKSSCAIRYTAKL